MQRKILLIATIVCGLVLAILTFTRSHKQSPPPQNPSPLPAPSLIIPTSTPDTNISSTTTASTSGLKTYRNEQWDFEFQYPENWTFEENTVYSPFSKFNVIGHPLSGIYITDPIVVNVVIPDFAERQFSDLNSIASTTVSGATGEMYEYSFEGTKEIAIILPFEQYKLILGAKKPYKDVFNQVLASFKFLK